MKLWLKSWLKRRAISGGDFMITVRSSQQRGRSNYGWLDSKHSFSFAQYYDPQQMGFSALRVINDDIVKPGGGFATHGHRDMEIITYVLEGAIEHKDSEGHIQRLVADEFQLMSAGRGIQHSEYNASQSEDLRLLQIWIEPNRFAGKPEYRQKVFPSGSGLTTIATATGENGSLQIKQDAQLHKLLLQENSTLEFAIESGRHVYVHLIEGTLFVDNTQLHAGDGAKIEAQERVVFVNRGEQQVKALVFDLP
jgi:redox-sensitive bicupin YhaK (pirin superfamily)